MSDLGSRRVVVTGAGLVSPIGNSKEALWDALTNGRSGVAPLSSVPTDFLPMTFGGEARDFKGQIDDFGPLEKKLKRAIKKGLNVMCREIEMGVAAAQFALADANLEAGKFDPERTGVVFGSDYIMSRPEEFSDGIRKCLDEHGDFDFEKWAEQGLPEVTPLWLLKYLPNMPASHVAIYNDLRGPNNSITLREASANLAVGEAFWTIKRGSADAIIAGSTGSRIHPIRTVHVVLQEQIAANGVEPSKASRPFDKDRTGMVLGEGGGAVVLEELETAKARGATILAEVIGHGSSTVMDRQCIARKDVALRNALSQAIRSAGLTPEDIGHIHAHGLSTPQCDIDESRAIRDVFGARADTIPVVAAKSYFGNLGAASGVVEMVASVMALRDGRLFPILNYTTPDPDCPISAVTTADALPGDNFISANVTPQGQASAIVVQKFT